MAPQKRPAGDDLDADESEASSSHGDTSSQLDPESRKRRRISAQSDTTPEQDQSRRRTVNRTSTAQESSGDSSHDDSADDDNDEAEQAATQVIREKRKRDKDRQNVPREYGVLQRVEVHNFMNHQYFQFDLGPLINFICGKNGSGKSALLTAIIICLGGKASATSRGNSLKKFIREGSDRAKIICTIKNEGQDAYMHDEFGDQITVERHFTQSGTSGFSIKTASGRIYSHKRSDLDPILDHCNLQMDNPLNVLTQDSAREFLHKSSPADKYRFFLKGVQLEQLDQDYRLIEEQLSNIDPRLQRKKEDVVALEQIMDEKNRQRDLVRRRDGMKEKAREVRRQIIWIQVQNQEEIVEEYAQQTADLENKLMELQVKVDQHETAYQQAATASDMTDAARTDAATILERHTEEKSELKAAFDEAKAHHAEAQADTRAVKDALEASKAATDRKKQEIVAEEQHQEEVNGDGPAQRQRQLAEAQTRAREAHEAFEQHKNEKPAVEQDALRKKSRIDDTHESVKKHEASVADIRAKLAESRNLENQQWKAFRPGTERLVNLINQETRFHHQPIGPIGKHVKILKPEWSSIIERTLGRSLDTFITFDKHDHRLLVDLKNKANCGSEIATITRRLFDIREPDLQFDTVYRVLSIADPYVRKHLILQHSIEQFILIADQKTATDTLYDSGTLHNVKGCYAQDPYNRRKGMLIRYSGGDGGASQDPVSEWQGPERMATDRDAVMAERRQALEKAQDELKQTKDIWQAARADSVRAEQAVKRHERRLGELKIAYQQADDEVDQLKSEIEGDQIDGGKLIELQHMLRECEAQQQLTEDQFKDAIINQDTKRNAMRERQKAMADYDTILKEAEQQYKTAQRFHRDADVKKQQALLEKNGVLASQGDMKVDLQRSIDSRLAAEATLEAMIGEATQQCPRVRVPEGATHKRLLEKYEKYNKEHNAWRRQLGFSADEAEEAAIVAKKAFEQSHKDFDDLAESKEMLEESLRDRRARWKKFRRFITVRARVTFVALLSERGFRGELLVNHDQHLLDLRVEPDITKSSAAGRGARTLSGGEKSFSQICMLLAMWEAMGSPIRCLDEFDVFMDAVNRSLSIKMIIEAARTSVGKQYILISPGSKTDIEKAHDVHAMELIPPERGQQTLEAGARIRRDP